MLQHRMAFLPPATEIISDHLAVARCEGSLTFFAASGADLELSAR